MMYCSHCGQLMMSHSNYHNTEHSPFQSFGHRLPVYGFPHNQVEHPMNINWWVVIVAIALVWGTAIYLKSNNYVPPQVIIKEVPIAPPLDAHQAHYKKLSKKRKSKKSKNI